MKNIRIEKDIVCTWTIHTNKRLVPLEGRNLKLILTDQLGRESELPFEIVDSCKARFRIRGDRNDPCGLYTLTMKEDYGDGYKTALDACECFKRVSRTCKEGGEDIEGLDTEALDLEGCMEVMSEHGIYSKSITDIEVHTRETFDALETKSDTTLYVIK